MLLGCVEAGFRIAGNSVTVGTAVLIALLFISGLQLSLFAMWFDMETNKDLSRDTQVIVIQAGAVRPGQRLVLVEDAPAEVTPIASARRRTSTRA